MSGVENNGVDKFFKISVQKWGTGENDCLSRVAQTSLKNKGDTEGASSWSAIEAKQKEIQDYNNKYNDEKIENADVVSEGQEILIPIEDAIEGIKEEFETVTKTYDEKQTEVETKTTELEGVNDKVSEAFDKLQQCQSAYDSDNESESAKSDLQSAKREYRNALAEQEKAETALKKAQEEAEEAQEKLDKLEEDLEEYTDRKDQKEEEIDEKLKEIAGNIEGLEDDLSKAQEELDKMKQELEEKKKAEQAGDESSGKKSVSEREEGADNALSAAQNNKYTAKMNGFIDEEGNLISEDDAENVELNSSILERGEVKSRKTDDGSDVIEFEDGSSYDINENKFVEKDGTTTDGVSKDEETDKDTELSELIEEIADVLNPNNPEDYNEGYKNEFLADVLKDKSSDEILEIMNEWDSQNSDKNNRLREYIANSFLQESDDGDSYETNSSDDENQQAVRDAITNALGDEENSDKIKEWLDNGEKYNFKASEDSEEKEYSLSEVIERDNYAKKFKDEDFAEFADEYSEISASDFEDGDVDIDDVKDVYNKYVEVNEIFDNFTDLYEILAGSDSLGDEYLSKSWDGTNGKSIADDKNWLDNNGRNKQTDTAIEVYSAHIEQMQWYIEKYGSEEDKAKLKELGL